MAIFSTQYCVELCCKCLKIAICVSIFWESDEGDPALAVPLGAGGHVSPEMSVLDTFHEDILLISIMPVR